MKRPRGTRALAGAIVAILLALVCLCALTWRLTGGRLYAVATPSMGQAAPVGTLLLTRPTSTSALHVGDLITFHPPGDNSTYSHRVADISADGIKTKGDINGQDDPWTLHDSNLVGKVAYRGWGLGWVLRALPLYLFCLAITWLVAACFRPSWRSSIRLVGSALSFSAVAWLLHPFVAIRKLDTTAAGDGGVLIRTVSTGILPVRAKASGGGSSGRLVDGQVGSVHVLDVKHHAGITAVPSPTFWWWVAITLFCLTPLLWCLIVGLLPAAEDGESGDDHADQTVEPLAEAGASS